jgi:hypothetical protein
MCQFHNGHYGKADLDFSVAGLAMFEDLPHCVALPFSGDDHAGIKN